MDPDLADHWDNAPCGHLIAYVDGRIDRVNRTLLDWLGYDRDTLRDKAIGDLLTVGGRIHYETHFGPLLRMSGQLSGIALDLVAADGSRLPMLLTANVKTGTDGRPDRIRITVLDAKDRRAYERELVEQRRRAETEKTRVQVFAETVRRSLQPPMLSPPPGLDVADYFRTASAEDVGGDFYDLFQFSPTTWGFFLGDVEGKGVDAAVVTGLTRYVLHSAAISDADPVQVLRNLNSVLVQKLGLSLGKNRLCSLIYGNLMKSGDGFDVEMASGGHLPPLLFGGDGSAYYADIVGGHALGMTDNPHFVAERLHLGPGDTLMLYTDGLTEARIGSGKERFDDHGELLRFAKACAPAGTTAIVDAFQDLLDGLGAGVQDDIAVLAMGVPPAAQS